MWRGLLRSTQNSTSQNIRWGVLMSYASLLISLLGSLFVSNKVLHYIGDYNYGLYTFVTSITSWLTVLSSALIASYLRFAAIDNRENQCVDRVNSLFLKILSALGGGIILIGCTTVLAFYFTGTSFGGYTKEDSALIYALLLLSIINIGTSFITAVFQQYINYKKQFIFDKGVSIIVSVLGFAGHYVIARYTRNILLLAAFSLVTTTFTFVCNYTFCRQKLQMRFAPLKMRNEKAQISSILVFSSVLVFNSIVDQINSNVDKTLLGFFSIPENITMYQMGQLFQTYLASVVTAVSVVFAPTINDMCIREDEKGVCTLFSRVSRLQGIVVCFVAFGFVSCGKNFIFWWLGDGYTAAYDVGAVLMLLSIMPLSVKLAIEVQRAKNMHRFRSYLFFAVAMLNILLSLLFLVIMPKKYAIYACLLGTIISNIICQWIGMNIYNSRKMKLPMGKHLAQLAKYVAYGIAGFVVSNRLFNVFCTGVPMPYLAKFMLQGMCYTVVFLTLLLAFDRGFVFSFVKKQ